MNDGWIISNVVLAQDATLSQPPASPAAQGVSAVGMPGQAGTPTTVQPGSPTGQPAPAQRPAGGDMGVLFWILPVMLLVMILMSFWTSRKDKAKRQELMGAIKKQVKVQMLGGIIGTVVEIGDDDI